MNAKRKKGQFSKAIHANNQLQDNLDLAHIGNFDKAALELVEKLELVVSWFGRDNTAMRKGIHQAMADNLIEPPASFDRVPKSKLFEAVSKSVHFQKLKDIRAIISELFFRIYHRDASFFKGLATILERGKTGDGHRLDSIDADPLRFQLCILKMIYGNCNRLPMTLAELEKCLSKKLPFLPSRRAIKRACGQIGFELKPDRKGRPKNKSTKT
jgi:hypothetical protein